MKKILAILISTFYLIACNKTSIEETKQSHTTTKQVVNVTLAPFDKYPTNSRFPINFRFSATVAPADRAQAKNFEKITITPSRHGIWSWASDSELRFEPHEDWLAGEKLVIDLSELQTSSSDYKKENTFEPSKFEVVLPEPQVHITECSLAVFNKAPLVQFPKIKLNLNYPANLTEVSKLAELQLIAANAQENIEIKPQQTTGSGLFLEFSGAELFKPDTDSTLKFTLKSGLKLASGGVFNDTVECTIPNNPDQWTKLSAEIQNKQTEKPLTVVRLTAPTKTFTDNNLSISPLSITFAKAWSNDLVEHGKAKGLTLEQGLKLDPEILGTWKTDEESANKINFIPKEKWAVDQKIKLTLDAQVFSTLELKESTYEFTTAPIVGRLLDAQLYTDPTTPNLRKATAKIEFSHLPKFEQLNKFIQAKYRIEPDKDFSKAQILNLNLKQDEKEPRRVFIETENITLPNEPGEVSFALFAGVPVNEGNAISRSVQDLRIAIPSIIDVFKINTTAVNIVKNSQSELQRILSVDVSEPVSADQLKEALSLYLLPDCKQKANRSICKKQSNFANPSQVDQAVLSKSELLPTTALERDEKTAPNLFHFSYQAPGNRELYIRINNSLKSKTNFTLSKVYQNVLFTEEFKKELSIMHAGSLLSLSGDKTIGVSLRNVKKIQYELARILPGNVHHLVNVTSGKFSEPYFYTYSVGLDQLAETFRYEENFPERDSSQTFYTTVNFERFVSKNTSPRGLFLLTVREQANPQDLIDPNCYSEYESDCRLPQLESKRLVLLTDLGILVKDAVSGEHSVFAMSFRTGLPVKGAVVKLLGQNGIALFTATTDENGRANFPVTKDFKNEKVPLLYTIEQGQDFSFLPFNRYDRQLNFSSFDIAGIYNNEEAESLRAQIFSDRGIYRPGEEAKFGLIVRRRDLSPVLNNLPLEISIRDPRGVEVQKKKFMLSALGFDEYQWSAQEALTGTYTISLNLVRSDSEGERRSTLATSTYRVDEFQPDKLQVKASYQTDQEQESSGWYSQNGKFSVAVQNLFGTPASNNKVAGKMLITPWNGTFKDYPDYTFYHQINNQSLPQNPEDLGELKTDQQGMANFIPDLSKYAERAFQVEFSAEAFEKDSGRSVLGFTKLLVANAPYFLGWKSDGRLDYINHQAQRKIKLQAVNAKLTAIDLKQLNLKLEETRKVSALVKQPNGTLQYQLTPKVHTVSETKLDLKNEGGEILLNTSEAGEYKLTISDNNGIELGAVAYTVIGESNKTFMADRNAEVGLKLSKSALEKGEELELSINVPYTGSGLITIERDKVYASKWFKADSLSTVQTIKVPNDVIGNAYVSVVFVRSLDSKEIYSAPLSYAVKPFSIAKSEYTASIELKANEKVTPGESIDLSYKLQKPGKLLVYAVDEGILQFARYKTPDPVSHFIPKRALEVESYQILDLILPDHSIVAELSSIGGDEDVGLGKFKNPFARKRRAPMVFWSGIVPAGSLTGKISIPVPEYFNGTVRIIGVTATDAQLGVTEVKTIAQADIVVEPQVPYFVSPNDEFEVGATIANTLLSSGVDVPVKVEVVPSNGLQIVNENKVNLNIPAGTDSSFRIKVKAGSELGEQSVKVIAHALNKVTEASETISVRPSSMSRLSIQAGSYIPENGANSKTLNLTRQLFPETKNVRASLSASPLTFARALTGYLKEYPYGCTEQIISMGMPAIIFGNDPDFGFSEQDVKKFSKRALQAISSRQKADGSIGMWDSISEMDPLFTVYALHFLLEAKEQGHEIPEESFQRIMEWARELNSNRSYEQYTQLAQSYALYLRARQGERVTKLAKALVSELDRQWKNTWRDSIMAVFLSGTFKLLQVDDLAQELLKPYPKVWNSKLIAPLNDPALFMAVYTYVSAKHFSADKLLSANDTAQQIANMIADKNFNSFTGAFSVLALSAYSQVMAESNNKDLKVLVDDKALNLEGNRILSALILENAKQVSFQSAGSPFFYELSEYGADQNSVKPYANGVSITRELKNEAKNLSNQFSLQDKLDVTLYIKADEYSSRVAVVELIPSGFEIDLSDEGLAKRKSLTTGPNTWKPEFIDIQEDRIIFFGDLPKDTVDFTYRLKPLTKGKFTFPAPFAEGMYDQGVGCFGESGVVEVK